MTDVLRAENKRLCTKVCRDFEDRLPPDDLALLEWLYGLRVDEVHLTGADVQRETGTIPITEAIRPQTYFPGWVVAGGWLGSPDAPEVPRIGVIEPRATDSRGQVIDLIRACEKCVELAALVADAERGAAAMSPPGP